MLILHHLPVTLTLALSAIFVTLIVAIPLGTIAALYPNSLIDRLRSVSPYRRRRCRRSGWRWCSSSCSA
jgi:ABC-type dipeptide/oligopeptide/nickel transport system permease component